MNSCEIGSITVQLTQPLRVCYVFMCTPTDAAAFEAQADLAVASFVWHTRPDGTVDLPPAGVAMADADDPGEDDVDMLQVQYNCIACCGNMLCQMLQTASLSLKLVVLKTPSRRRCCRGQHLPAEPVHCRVCIPYGSRIGRSPLLFKQQQFFFAFCRLMMRIMMTSLQW